MNKQTLYEDYDLNLHCFKDNTHFLPNELFRLRVSAWGKLRGQLEGLCGDFDELSSNDFMTPTGEIVENITNFVNSWVIGGYDSEG